MEPALFQFLIGIVGGSVLGFALMRIRTITPITIAPIHTLQTLPKAQQLQPVSGVVDGMNPEPVPAVTVLAIAQSPVQPLVLSIQTVSQPESKQETLVCHVCPACGLQAPEKLMKEHFLGSPLHRNSVAPVSLPSVAPALVSTSSSSIVAGEDESDRSSLGALLQTLEVMEGLLKRDFYRHELRVRSGIGGRMANICGWVS